MAASTYATARSASQDVQPHWTAETLWEPGAKHEQQQHAQAIAAANHRILIKRIRPQQQQRFSAALSGERHTSTSAASEAIAALAAGSTSWREKTPYMPIKIIYHSGEVPFAVEQMNEIGNGRCGLATSKRALHRARTRAPFASEKSPASRLRQPQDSAT